MLSDRRQRILYALIEEYVAHAMPVGSQTIAKQYRLGVSSATIRNELSVLEEDGYIIQPHTSAGRVPTDAGYREFVDGVLESCSDDVESQYVDLISDIRKHADELDDLMERTSAELTRLTDCLSIVVAPSIISSHIRQISFISMSDTQALIVIVLKDGQVLNHSVSFDVDVSAEKLQNIQNVFSKFFLGKQLKDMDSIDKEEASEIFGDPIANHLFNEIIRCLSTNGPAKASRVGISNLMMKPEFHDSSSLLPLMEILEDDTVLFGVLDDNYCDNKEITVRIGNENITEQLFGVSVVAGTYGRNDAQGVVAVIGPKRMNYTNVIRAVRAAQNALNDD